MRTPVYARQFEKDVNKAKKRGKNLEKRKIIARALIEGEKIDPIHKDHALLGNFAEHRECHIESDRLLIYKVEKGRIIFERTGSHSDLFKR